jgi:N12 class adenine-specific DNA methylase
MPIDNSKLKQLYATLQKGGYEQDYDTFVKGFTGNDHYANRKQVYDLLSANGAQIGSSYEEFMQKMQAPKPQAQAQRPAAPHAKPQVTTSAAPAQQKPAATAAPAPQKKGWQPTEQQKIQMSYNLGQMRQQVQQGIANTNAKIGRMMMPVTKEGRKKLNTGKFAAQMAGTPTRVVGFAPPQQPSQGKGGVQQQGQKPVESEQSPLPYGVVYENGKPKTQWLLPDGTLTTSLTEANHAEYAARKTRLAHQFQDRMKENGLDPNKPEDVQRQAQLDYEAPLRKALEAEWQRAEAEDRAADEQYRKDYERAKHGGFFDRLKDALLTPTDPNGLPMQSSADYQRDLGRAMQRKQTFNLETLAQAVYQKMPQSYRDSQILHYSDYFRKHPEELKGRSVAQAAKEALQGEVYRATYDRAVQAHMPKSKTEFLMRKIADQPFLSQSMATDMAASALTGSYSMSQAEADAMGRYGQEHRTLDIVGTVANMAFDPVTYISGGVGGAAAKKAMQYTGKAMLKGAGKEVAGRYAGRTIAGRLLGGAAGGVGNFATYNTLTNIEQQMRLGGALDPATGEREFSGSEVLKSTLHGVVLGAVTGALSPVIGNVADKWVKATSNTAGKVGIRAGELATSTIAEGTIFAAPEWVENAQLADDNPNKRSAMDIWTDNLAMMLGFKASHGIKSAPRVIAGMRPVAEPKTMEERNHNRMSFMERLRKQLDSSPRDLDLTQEEREELRKQGYGELADLFRYTPKQKPAKPQSEAKPKMTDGKTMTFDIVKHNGVEEVNAERVTNPEFDGYSAMEALMQDPTVSQSTRAKAYYILTGRQLPMGTVTGYTKDKDEHGNIYVKAVTANGEVVTNKRFADESSAKQEENNILRQAELNSVDVGERYKETAANIKVVQAAVEQVAPGADFGTVMRNYKAVKEGDADAVRNYGGMVRDIDKAIEANKTMADAERPEAIRAAIKEETGVDVDDAIKKGPGKRNEQEQAAVEDYIKRLYPVEKGSEAVAERPMLEEEAGASAIYDQSRLLWDKVEQGDAEAKADVDAIVMRMQEAYELCEDAFGTDAEWRMAEMKEDPWAMVKNSELTEDQQDAVLYYINAKAAMDGVQDASNDAMDNKRKEVAANVERHTHKDSGMVLPATMKVDDKPVYVVKGKVAVYPDGSGIDAAKSDQSIVICDAETGEYMFTSPDQIFNLGDAIDPQAELDEAYANIQAEHEAVLGGMENGESVPKSGESVHETPENVQNEGENVQQPMTDEQLQQYAQGAFNEATQGDGGVTLPQEQVEQMQQHNQQMLEQDQQRREEEANRQPTALERVPLNEETGEPMFEKADKETALDALNEVTGGNEANTTAIVNAQVEQAQKTLDALKKKQPTKKAPSLKGSPMAMVKAQQEADANYNAAMEQYNAQVANAEETLGAWSRIYTLMNERKRAIREQQEAEQRERDKQMHDAAVAQVEEQKRIAAQKAAEQAEVGTHAVNPKIKAKWDGAAKVEGNPNALTLADGSTIRGHYVLTEAGAASASHDVNNAFEPTEGFPIDENGESVNDRDYKRDTDAQRIVRDIANSYDSRALQSPVIVSKDGVVLSGNNRTMSGDIAAQQGTDKAYIDHLREFGQMYGFTPEQIDGMKHPRVVFVPDEQLPYDATTFARFNAEQQKKQSKPEHAVKLGKIVPDNVFTSITNDISRFDRLSDYYADDKAVSSAISQLLGAGVINEMQLPEMRTGNSLSAAGKELIENTLIGKVFQTSPDAVRHIISTPTLRQSVIMGLNEIAHNRTLAKSGYDLSNELGAAVDLVARAKSAHPDIFKDGMPVSPFGREQGLFDDEYGDSRVTDGVTLLLADLLNSGKPSDLRKVLSTYNNEAASPASGQIDMFSGDVTSREDVLNNVLNYFRNATPREQQAIVDAAVAERKRRAEAEPVEGSQGSEQTENAVRGSEETKVGKLSVNDGRGDKGRIGEWQGDLEKTEESSELDDNGIPFVKSSNGTTIFGEIRDDSGLTPAPIKLSEGFQDENGKGYGLVHIEAGHGSQIRNAGFKSVEDFVSFIAQNYDEDNIRVGKRRANGNTTYLIQVSDEHDNTLFIEMSRDNSYWNVNSAGIFRKGYSNKKETVAKTEPQQPNNAISSDSSLSDGKHNGIMPSEPNGESTVSSVSKVINNQSTLQGNAEKSVGGEGETSLSEQIATASAEVNTAPTEAQKEAGNYKKGHVQVGTFDITIEQPQGSVRKGTDADGKQWESKMHNTYGYIRGAVGVDGDHIDVFLSNDIDGWNGHKVFVVDQYNPDGTFDEHKVMLGFNDADEAKSDYLANYEKGWEDGRRIDITGVNLEDFEKWIESSKRKTKPFGEYASVKKDVVEVNAPEVGYSITPSTYTNKKGKTSNVSLLTFDNDLTADQERAVKEFAKERTGEGRFAPARGWKDRESGGWIFRNEEDARKAAEMVGNEEAVADNQPMTAQELRDAVKPKKPTARKKTVAKKPANRVEVADVVEQKPSEPTKAEQPKQDGEKKLVITDEMKHDEDILRELLGIGDEELDGGIKFRDPDAMTSQQRRFVYNAGVNYSLGYIDQGFVAFLEFAKAMVGRLGYKIKPWLKSFYEGVKRIPGYDQAMFTPTEEVDGFDVENFDKPNKDVLAQANMIVEENKAQVAADKANNELKTTRNEQRKEIEKQTAANTDAVAAEAETIASKAEALAKTSSDEQALAGAAEQVDGTLDKVNEQLALLGYYEAEEVEKDYNEAYGYMRNAEKKSVKDAANLASQLINDLGLDRFEATHTDKVDKKGNRKTKPLAISNISPVGGDVSIHLPLEEGRELYLTIGVEPRAAKGVDGFGGSDLEVTHIMFRVDHSEGTGNDRYGRNVFVDSKVTYSDLLKQVQREAYKYLPGKAEAKEGEYYSGDKVEYSPDGGRTWHDAVVAQPNDEGGFRIDTGLAPAMWVNAHSGQLRHKAEARKDEDIFQKAERIASENRYKRAKSNVEKLKPIGKGSFGDVYNQFQGNAQEAFAFLKEKRSGDVLGVFSRDGVGDIDVVWGDKGGGLSHIIDKHVGEGKSFLSVDEAAKVIDSIIKTGDKDFENGDKIVFKKESKLVTIRKNVRDKGKKIADKNWILTAYDELSADGDVSAIAPNNQGQAARTTDNSRGKGIGNSQNNQEDQKEKTTKKVKPEQQVGDLFAGLFDKSSDNGLQGNDASIRTEAVPADHSGQRQGLRGSQGNSRKTVAQEGGRPDGGRGGQSTGEDRAVSAGLHGLTEPKNTRNNHSERGADHAPTSVNGRIEANIKAIELAHELLESGETATPEQMSVLRQFSGWGGLGAAFSDGGYDWKQRERNKKIRELLGEEAYEQAVMSANSAYYTPAYVVDTLWDIANQLGFKGGNILEGSAGIGNILGQMPTMVSGRSDIHAIEIDGTSGGILSLLYPDAKVEIQGFEQTRIPNGSVDLAITNVPFVTGLRVNDTTGDSDLSKKFHNIHDFCIAKNVRKLREGGLGIFISSNGTLDNSKALRDWVVNEGGSDFIGAFRMNNKTFGGTTVTSDIIVIRKRVNGQKSAQAIDVSSISGERTAEYEEPGARKAKQLSMDYNKYFIEHPDHMAGEMRFAFEAGDTFRPTSKGLYPVSGKDQGKMLADFVKSFTEETGSSVATMENAKPSYVSDVSADGKKLGEMYLKDGKLVTAGFGGYYPLEVNDKKIKGHTKQECFTAYAAIKDALAEVMQYQTENEGDEGLKPLIAKLNKAYDAFVSTYGHFNKNNQLAWLRNDVDYPNVFSLETYKEQGDGKGGVVKTYDKADVMKGRVVEKESEPHPENVNDGVVVSMFKNGRIDVPYIASQLGKSEAEVKREIIDSGLGFEDPATRQMEVSYQYLSGNVREKLKQAEANNENGEYSKNIKALQEVVPMNIPAHLIDFTLGSSWLDPKLYDAYVKERTDIDVHFTAAGGTWFMKAPTYGVNVEKNRAMGIVSEKLKKTIMGHELISAAIQNKSIVVSRTEKHFDGTTGTVTDREATAACAAKIDEIRQDFKDWVRGKMQRDADLSARMEQAYNDRFNNYVPMSIPNDFVPEYFGGATHKFKMRSHQGKAIVRGTMQPLLLAHEVGTGKTFTLISTAMEMRRLGTARKPMIVVQNATVGQFAASAKELYPNAKVLVLDDNDRDAEGRKNFYAKIKYNDWDMVIIPQSTLDKIPDSDERQMQFKQDKIDEKMLVLEQMREADSSGRDPITRRAEKELADLQAEMAALTEGISKKRTVNDEKKKAVAKQNAAVKAEEMLDRRTDDVENFDDMGIDALLIDEAHEYKHLGFATAMQRGVKGVDPSYSKKSQGVYLKTQAVLEKNNGRNVIFATGTPISNTAAEIWTFMRYLMPKDTMKEYGIYYFDDFVRNFGNLQQMMEFKTNGKFQEVNRFAGYVNLPELVRIWSGVADTALTKDQTELVKKIPEMEGGKAQDIYLPQTRALRSVMKYVREELERFDQMSGKEKKENSSIPLIMYGIAQGAAVDARLVEMHAEDDSRSKTNEAVRQTLRSLKETDDYKGTVAIFADHYQNKHSGFNLYEDIKKKLIQQGVPASEIVVMKSGMKIKQKLEIFDKVNRGEVRVILGSTATLGTGVNIQERLHTLIHLDAPNRPMDYTQRNGRILRQGNLHKEWNKPVRVLRFGVEDSLDVTAYQRLKTKGAIADSVMESDRLMQDSMNNRVLEEEEDVFGDTVAQLSGSEYALLKNNAEKNVRKYESRKKQWEADQTYIHNAKPKLVGQIKSAAQRAEEANAHLLAVQKAFPDGKFTEITVGKLKFASVDAMTDFIKDHNRKILDAAKDMKENPGNNAQTNTLTLSLGGYDFVVKTKMSRETVNNGGLLFAEIHRKMSYSCPELGLNDVPVKQSLLRNAVEDITENVITGRDFAERFDIATRMVQHGKSELEQLKQREGKPFEFGKELEEAKRQFEEYSEAMKVEMAEKEKKYAEMDASVEAASDVVIDEEDEDSSKHRMLDDDAQDVVEPDFMRENLSNAMEERVTELSERLHTPVRIIRTEEEVAALPSVRQRRMKGSFNPMTGEVTIVVPNNANMADIENTFVHEVVGHDGLRVLFPEEAKLNNALDELYRVSKDEIRGTIDRMAQKMYDAEVDRLHEKKRKEHEARGEDSNTSYYADMAEAHAEASKKREQFKRDATEEYGADLAGRIGEKGFEKMSAEELTFWGKLKAMLQKALQKLLDGLKIPGKRKWGDKDWAFVLHEAYKRKKNGGRPTVFDAADTEVMRRKTGFGDTKFSDGKNKSSEPKPIGHSTFGSVYNQFKGKVLQAVKFLVNHENGDLLGVFHRNDVGDIDMVWGDEGGGLCHILNKHINDKDFPTIKDLVSRIEDIINKGEVDERHSNADKLVLVKDGYLVTIRRNVREKGIKIADKNWVLTAYNKDAPATTKAPVDGTYGSTAVAPGTSSDAKLATKSEINEFSDNNVADEGVMFRDGDMGLEETITKMKVEASQANADNWQAKQDAMRAIGGNLNKLRQAMARQRAYDLWTVKSVTDLAQILLDNGLLDDMSKYEYNRILSAVKNVHGKKDISKYVDKVMDVMVGNQLRAGETRLGRLERIRASKVDAKGIDVQGQLDADGQAIMKAFRSAKPLSVEELDKKILEATDRMSNTNEQIAANAALEHTGLLLAKQYVDGVSESKKAVAQFKDEVKKAEEEMNAGQMTEEAFKQFKNAIDETIKQLKIDRIEAYNNLADSLGGVLGESVERAKQWKEAEKERVNKIHHLANSDMQGRELKGHRPDTKVQWLANSWVARFAFEPLSTFDQMLKMFGSKNPNGEGYMQDYFMRHWIDSTDNEQLLKERYQKQMDDKAAEIFGKKYKYLDLYGYVQTQKSATVKYYDGADMREYEIAQDGLLYLYAVEKMPMGKATNRRMGITDETMEKITDALDPKLKEFADWVQEDFLPSIGMESDVVYTRMFGTHMDSIEKYFPFVRDKDALKRDVENGQSNSDNDRISVQTGAIKKRVASVALWNLKDMSFLDVLAKHVGEMSHWQSFAELNRDIGTLLSYNRFKQQVMNMSSVYGSGKELWKRFEQCAAIATDCYEPQRAKFDRLMVQGAKGVTMGKIAFRPFTALKQTLSLPAFFGEVNAIDMAEALATCGIPALKWSWNNMPNFRKRILSRTTGDYRLRETEYDSKIMKAASYGMLPNIGVDAWTIAVGSHCVYKAQKRKYLRWGMEEERAERRAVQDAEMCFNKSQQSSEGAYMAPIQIDHTFYATSAMLFRNSSTAYTRETHNSARNLKRIFSGEVSEDYVTKQILRTIHPNAEDYWSDAEWAKARAEAKREIRSAKVKNGVNLVMFGWILPWLWRIGGTSVLLALTGDNEERAKQLIDATKQSVFAPMEGLTYGDVFEGGINKVLGYTEQSWSQQGRENPMISDMKQMLNELDYDWVQATNDVLNILGGMTTGVNPQTFTDWAVAIMDFCGDDAKTSRECALLAARLLNCPQSQLDKVYLEELDMTAAEAKGMTPAEVAERYARYKMMREAPLTGWMRSAEKSDSISAKKQNKVFTIAKEKLNSRMETEETKQLLSDYDAVAKQKTALSKIKKTDRAAYREGMKQLRQSNDMRQHMRLKRYKHDMNELTSKYLRCKSAEERDSIVSTMFSTRAKMLDDIGRMKQQ